MPAGSQRAASEQPAGSQLAAMAEPESEQQAESQPPSNQLTNMNQEKAGRQPMAIKDIEIVECQVIQSLLTGEVLTTQPKAQGCVY